MKRQLPWHASRKGIFINDLNNNAIAEMCDSPTKQDDAEFIALAVNTHDALVKALDDLVAVYEYCSEDPVDRGWAPVGDAVDDARRLLAVVGSPSHPEVKP
jgi:hypothetical protein